MKSALEVHSIKVGKSKRSLPELSDVRAMRNCTIGPFWCETDHIVNLLLGGDGKAGIRLANHHCPYAETGWISHRAVAIRKSVNTEWLWDFSLRICQAWNVRRRKSLYRERSRSKDRKQRRVKLEESLRSRAKFPGFRNICEAANVV